MGGADAGGADAGGADAGGADAGGADAGGADAGGADAGGADAGGADAGGATPDPLPVGEPTDMKKLRNELQAWLLAESSEQNANLAGADLSDGACAHASNERATSLDALFSQQSASGPASQERSVDAVEGAAATRSDEAGSSYENVMNGGELDTGLKAWDTMESSFAPLA